MADDDGIDPYAHDPYDAPDLPPPRRRRTGLVVALTAVVALVVGMTLAGVAMLVGDPHATEAEVGAASSAPGEAEAAPISPTQSPTPSQPAASDAPATPEPARSPAAEARTPSPDPAKPQRSTSTATLSRADALRALDTYLTDVVRDPALGWQQLTRSRRAQEDATSYADWWGGLSSAHVSNCRYDDASMLAVCDLVTRNDAGLAGVTTDVPFQLVMEDGEVRIGLRSETPRSDDEVTARLQELWRESLDEVRLDGHWVAELSAKRPGNSDPLQVAANGTNTFFAADILAMHESLRDRFPQVPVLLLHSTDWGAQKGHDLWHTFADGGFESRAEVEAWCVEAFPELTGASLTNQCLPRTLRAPHEP
ncbi:hypothetical protein [uncultured Tessaracoccus sp.]|uniref:hypothetical protein n=1 Tax=uncultured Tessaracoccus sp. TaxID=905023 RepID=UPI0025D23106|nr:hypothetical protein [uncultured Tessaracoccus sp.]